MPTAPHILRSPAVLPLAESTREELVDFGAHNLRAENIRQIRQGEATTRFGFAPLPTARLDATSATAGYKMFADRDSVVRISDTFYAEVYSQALARWVPAGRAPEATFTTAPLPAIGAAADSLGNTSTVEDVEYCNGYIASVHWTTPGVFASVIDATSGAVVVAPYAMSASSSNPQIVSFGTRFIAFVTAASGTTAFAYTLDTASAATIYAGWSVLATVGTDKAVNTPLAACSLSDRVAVAYVNDSVGTSRVTVKTFNASGVVETTTINTSSVTPVAVDAAGSNADTLWIAWNEAAIVKACGLTGNALATVKASTSAGLITLTTGAMRVFVSPSTTGAARVAATDTAVASARTHFRNIVTTATVATGTGLAITSHGAVMIGRPFYFNARHYAPFITASITGANLTTSAVGNTQNTFIVCDWTEANSFVRPVANVAPGTAATPLFMRCKTAAISATKFVTGAIVVRSLIGRAPVLVTMDFADPRRWQTSYASNSVFLSGGVASCFNGSRVSEVGFLGRPTKPTGTVGGTGITGTFRYIAVFEEVDADGNWHISGLSDPSEVVTAADDTVTVLTTPLAISSRFGSISSLGVRVAWYRTGDGGEAPYFRHPTTTSNDPSAANVTLVDVTPDATLTSGSKLYSQPGVLGTAQDKRPPPGFSCITTYNGMLVGASGSDVHYSGQNVSGEGVWFNPIFQTPIPGDGDITALWVQEGTLYAAKRREIYALSGEAPSDNGASGGLGFPRRLAVDVGCIEPRSVCVTSLGVFFQSERGMEILTRAQSVEWVGEAVQETLASYPIVTSATIDSSYANTVLFELATSESGGLVTGTGRTLVYGLANIGWISTDRRKNFSGTADTPSQSACIVYTGSAHRYAWMDATGRVHYEDRTSYLDANGSFVVPLIETGWFNAFQNELRVWRASLLFERYTAAGLKVEVAYDYGSYAVLDNKVWTEVDTGGQRQLEFVSHPRGETMKLRITTTAPASLGTGQGIGLFGITLDLDAKQGPTKGTIRLDPALRR